MELDELRTSVSGMTDDELLNEINKIRARRRSGVSAFTATKMDGARRHHKKGATLDEMQALMMALELESLDMDEEAEEETND